MIAALLALPLFVPLALDGVVTAETGIEYDSNATRGVVETEPQCPPQMPCYPTARLGSPLWRLQLGGKLRHSAGAHRLRLSLDLGGKLFLREAARSQDIWVVVLGVEEGGQLGRLRLSAFANYFDAYQRGNEPLPGLVDPTQRDFRLGEVGLRLTSGRSYSGALQGIDGGVDVLGQLFQFKPDNNYTYLAPSLQPRLTLRWHRGDPELGQDFDLSLTGRFDYRRYPLEARGPGTGRDDAFLQGGATVGVTGAVLAQLGYLFQGNLSTLTDESYQRHVLMAKVAVRVPWELYLTCKGQLNIFQSLRPADAPPPPQANIEDDNNRSLLLLDVSRALPRGFDVLVRYAFYFTASGLGSSDLSYQRHTVYLGLGYRFRQSR